MGIWECNGSLRWLTVSRRGWVSALQPTAVNTTPWNRWRTQTSHIYKKFTTTEEAADVVWISGGKQKRLSHEAKYLDLWPSVHLQLRLGILVTDKGELEREVQVCLWMPMSVLNLVILLKKKKREKAIYSGLTDTVPQWSGLKRTSRIWKLFSFSKDDDDDHQSIARNPLNKKGWGLKHPRFSVLLLLVSYNTHNQEETTH